MAQDSCDGVQMQLIDSDTPRPSLLTTAERMPDREPDRREIVGAKGSIFYRAHSYHTKVPPEGIAGLIEHYTTAGDFVLDPFCGSGMTGVAARLTGRHAVLSDLSPGAVHIASGYASELAPAVFAAAADRLLVGLDQLERNLYTRPCPACGDSALVEYTVWSDEFGCRGCDAPMVFWQEAIDGDGGIRADLECQSCGTVSRKTQLRWLRSLPVQQSLRCRCSRGRIQHDLTIGESAEWESYSRSEITDWYPSVAFERGREMWRGQHGDQGLATAADFFTPRNLHALARAWSIASLESDAAVRQAVLFLCTSVINRASRRYQWNPKRPTNVLSSTMYVASLSYEFNVRSLLRRKVKAITDLYTALDNLRGTTTVTQSPAQDLMHVPDSSIGYVFTDPPFGSNIFYADSSFLWEAWLNDQTDQRMEAVVNKSRAMSEGGKSLNDYEKLMTSAFEECGRVLRTNGWMSVMFHNSDDRVWSALERSIESAGFTVESAVAFDKSQASFKGLKGQFAGERVANFDLVLHLRRSRSSSRQRVATHVDANDVVRQALTEHLTSAPASRRTTPWMHSLAMRVLLEQKLPLTGFTFRAIEDLCAECFDRAGDRWRIRSSEVAQ